MKKEEIKASKKKRSRKKDGAKTNNNVNRNIQNANSARPLTPADTATRPVVIAFAAIRLFLA